MKRFLCVFLVAALPLAAFLALDSTWVDTYLARRVPGWARAAGLSVGFEAFDFDPLGPALRVSGLQVADPGAGWQLGVRSLEVRVRSLRSLLGTLHLAVEAEEPRLSGTLTPGAGTGGGRGLPISLDRFRVSEGAIDLTFPAQQLRLELPAIRGSWEADGGTLVAAGGAVT